MTVRDIAGLAAVALGLSFFVAGSIGLLRFPDVFSRLHALTKADVLGLGLVCLGLSINADSAMQIVELGAIWVLALVASVTGAQIIAVRALNDQRESESTRDALDR